MEQREKLNKGIESLGYRLAALAAKFADARDDEALKVAQKINVYGRAVEVLEAQKNKLPSVEANPAVGTWADHTGAQGWTYRS